MVDGTFLVQEACRLNKPFIFVTLNYRLGYCGFLSSRELKMEAEASNGEYCPNPGLHDQRLALQWVRSLQFQDGHYLLNAAIRSKTTLHILAGMLQMSLLLDNLPELGRL